jgi:hypothetical protein
VSRELMLSFAMGYASITSFLTKFLTLKSPKINEKEINKHKDTKNA